MSQAQDDAARRPTLEAVAAHVGVSRATVSRVVNGSPRVRPDVRERVEAGIRDLGYVPNLAARTLVTQRTDAVALVTDEPESLLFADPFFSGVIRGASHELAEAGLQTVLLLVRGQEDHARVERYLGGGHVDGAILFSLRKGDPLPDRVREMRLPVVFGGRPWRDAERSYYVDVDNRGGARTGVAHLRAIGRRRIGTITGPLDQHAAVDRLNGYCDVLGAGDDALVVHGDFTQAGGEAAMVELLRRAPDVDAVFAASDLMAAGALRALRREGRRVPEDVAVLGFDDHAEIAGWTEPPLSTIHQPIGEMGQAMVRLLLASLRGEAVAGRPTILPTGLVIRASA